MTTVITVKVKGDLEEKYREALEDLAEDETKSELVRNLLERGFRQRNFPLFARLDLPNRVGAQMEDDRERGESDETVTRRFLKEAVEAREADALDAIGGDEDLRNMVDRVREDGEELDEATRRLVRSGVESETAFSPRERAFVGGLLFSLIILPIIFVVFVSVGVAVSYALFAAGVVLFNPQINQALSWSRDMLSSLLDRIPPA
jgi:hypothetical protein